MLGLLENSAEIRVNDESDINFSEPESCGNTQHEESAVAVFKRVSVEARGNESDFGVIKRSCAFHSNFSPINHQFAHQNNKQIPITNKTAKQPPKIIGTRLSATVSC